MKNSVRNNKLWEGHRLYYPEMRELVLEGQKEKVSKPNLSDEQLQQFDTIINYAIAYKRPVLVRYFSGDQIKECVVLSFRLSQDLMICGNGKKISCTDIVEIEIC
jgi:hypothetical protein